MASILEKDANGREDARVISGILWKRFDAGMRLQADATLSYILGKESKHLTLSDLKTDSPYNTYLHTGLPAGPIGNPGMETLRAAILPEVSPYWYYLHDGEGVVHYAKNFAEHERNRRLYLK